MQGLTTAIQDYVKEIYKLQAAEDRATTSELADRLGVSAPSATAMLKKLAALGLVEHERYRGARLTRKGERVALEVIRHHRLLEQYLAQTLGLPIDAVHAEADRLEHALSEELEAHIDRTLGFPTHDPHGDPIPDAELNYDQQTVTPLAELAAGDEATISRVPDRDGELLRYLSELKLTPGARVEIRASAPFNGPVTVRVDGSDHAISRELAAKIGVT
ncbi:MAG: metal-dependent transcriptional regulator [Actinomycetota bacterium]|nr:metal-dependent transcriptional regulator [Actinomycetota bacterium]